MKDSDYLPVCSDNWWVEGKWAWFVWGLNNLLFCIDLNLKQGNCIAHIPDSSELRFKSNSRCIKYGNDIYCMPGYGKSIYVYNIKNFCQQEICIENPENVPIIASNFWIFKNKLYVVLSGLGQIIEINMEKKQIEKSYLICKGGNITKSIKVDNKIYSLLGDFNMIASFDFCSKEIILYQLPDKEKKFFTLCFDGEKFWLSGCCKEIYVWNRGINTIDILSDFTSEFGVYNFSEDSDGRVDCEVKEYTKMLFIDSVSLGQNIWFIPYQTNRIVYVNKETYEFHEFPIQEEEERSDTIPESIGYKYILEYVKDNRYIGLFSIKNRCMVEIDTLELKYQYEQYEYNIDDRFFRECAQLCDNSFNERWAWDRVVYGRMTNMQDDVICNKNDCKIGDRIYREMMSEF